MAEEEGKESGGRGWERERALRASVRTVSLREESHKQLGRRSSGLSHNHVRRLGWVGVGARRPGWQRWLQ